MDKDSSHLCFLDSILAQLSCQYINGKQPTASIVTTYTQQLPVAQVNDRVCILQVAKNGLWRRLSPLTQMG